MSEGFRIIPVSPEHLEQLSHYLNYLSQESRDRFGPHRYDLDALNHIYIEQQDHLGYLAFIDRDVIGYTVVKLGYLEHDQPRLSQYGLQLNNKTDCTIAPSVADAWQGQGIGRKLMDFVIDDLKSQGFKRMILWGGVQASNQRALAMYTHLGFETIGEFEYYGMNFDMIHRIA